MKAVSDHTGISQNTLSLLNQGKSGGIKFDTLEKLCKFLDCTPNDLLEIDVSEKHILGHFDKSFSKDGVRYIPFEILDNPNSPRRQSKSHYIVLSYNESQFYDCGGRVLNLTGGIPMYEDLLSPYSKDGFYSEQETSNYLSQLTDSYKETLTSELSYMSLKDAKYPPALVTVTIITQSRPVINGFTYQHYVFIGGGPYDDQPHMTIGKFSGVYNDNN